MQNSTLANIEKFYILIRLHEHNGNRTHTAKSLGIGLRTLQRKLHAYGLSKGASSRYVNLAHASDELAKVIDTEFEILDKRTS